MTTINREKTRDRLPMLKDKDLHWLLKNARRVLRTRVEARWALKERVAGGFIGLANVMKGVTWALACRQSLRRSKEHAPDTGKRPASGEMWLPYEILYAARHEVKERGWSPLTQQYADTVLQNLRTEAARRPPPADLGAVAFKVRMAAPQYAAVHFDENVLTGRS